MTRSRRSSSPASNPQPEYTPLSRVRLSAGSGGMISSPSSVSRTSPWLPFAGWVSRSARAVCNSSSAAASASAAPTGLPTRWQQDRVPAFRLAPLQRLPGQPAAHAGQEPTAFRRQHRQVHGVRVEAPQVGQLLQLRLYRARARRRRPHTRPGRRGPAEIGVRDQQNVQIGAPYPRPGLRPRVSPSRGHPAQQPDHPWPDNPGRKQVGTRRGPSTRRCPSSASRRSRPPRASHSLSVASRPQARRQPAQRVAAQAAAARRSMACRASQAARTPRGRLSSAQTRTNVGPCR
jgi:hypothetical protein